MHALWIFSCSVFPCLCSLTSSIACLLLQDDWPTMFFWGSSGCQNALHWWSRGHKCTFCCLHMNSYRLHIKCNIYFTTVNTCQNHTALPSSAVQETFLAVKRGRAKSLMITKAGLVDLKNTVEILWNIMFQYSPFPPYELCPGTRDFGAVLCVFPPRETDSK